MNLFTMIVKWRQGRSSLISGFTLPQVIERLQDFEDTASASLIENILIVPDNHEFSIGSGFTMDMQGNVKLGNTNEKLEVKG
jgi:hypothetical protein